MRFCNILSLASTPIRFSDAAHSNPSTPPLLRVHDLTASGGSAATRSSIGEGDGFLFLPKTTI